MAQNSKPSNPHGWRAGAPTSSTHSTSARRGKLRFVVGAILLLLGALAGVLWWLNPITDPQLVAVWIDQYDDPSIPVNAWAAQDSAALLKLPWKKTESFARQDQHLLLAELRNLEQRSDRPLVVYLGAFAVGGEDGQLYLLPANARLNDPSRWIPLAKVFEHLRACRAEHKLLILDIMRPLTAPRAGLLLNEVAERTRQQVEAAVESDRRLLVLSPCAPGQVSLPLEHAGRSLFGYYLEQGLKGAADGYGEGGGRDGRVSVREVAAFVRARVDRWAERCRAARQTPELLGTAPDFVLVSGRSRSDPPGPSVLGPYPDTLAAGWQDLANWRNSPRGRAPAAAYRRLETTLIQAENRWRGGTELSQVEAVVRDARRRFQQERPESGSNAAPRSLAAAVAAGQEPPDLAKTGARNRFGVLVQLTAQLQAAKPEEKDKLAAEQKRLDEGRKEFLKLFEGKPFDLAWALFELVAGSPDPRPEHLRCARDLFLLSTTDQPAAGGPVYAEIGSLLKLAEWGQDTKQRWSAGAVQLALQIIREAERADTWDARVVPWLRDRRDRAARTRQQGIDLLFRIGGPSWDAAEILLRDSFLEFQFVNRAAEVLGEGYRARDEALAVLPGHERYLESDRSNEKDWYAALELVQALGQLLARPRSEGQEFAVVRGTTEGMTRGLRQSRNKLGQMLEPDRLKKLIAQADHQGPTHGHRINAVLDCPWLTAADRKAVWDAGRSLSERLSRDTLAIDLAEDEAAQRTPDPKPFAGDLAPRAERVDGLARARRAVELLKLEGATELGDLEAALARTAKDPTDPTTWQALRRELRLAGDRRGTDGRR